MQGSAGPLPIPVTRLEGEVACGADGEMRYEEEREEYLKEGEEDDERRVMKEGDERRRRGEGRQEARERTLAPKAAGHEEEGEAYARSEAGGDRLSLK